MYLLLLCLPRLYYNSLTDTTMVNMLALAFLLKQSRVPVP